jgi:ankyrin repeat protein
MIFFKLIFIYIIMSSFVDYINKAHDLFGKYDVLSKQIIDNKKLLIKHYLENNSIDNEFVRKTLQTTKDDLYDNLKEYFKNLYSDLENNKYYENENELIVISEKILVLLGNSNNKKYKNLVFEYNKDKFYKICWNDKFIIDLINTDLNSQNNWGYNPYNIDLVQNNPYNIDLVQNSDGDTPLHDAIYENNIELVKTLDAYLNIQNNNGDTPLHAAMYENFELVKILVDKGADLNIQDKWGMTPLHIACYEAKYEETAYLIDNGADINIKDGDNTKPYFVGDFDIIDYIINKYTYTYIRDFYKNNKLHIACYHGLTHVVKYLIDTKDYNDEGDFTALHIACCGSYFDLVKILVENGCCVNVKDIYGHTPLDFASDPNIIAYLIEKMSH